MVSVNLSSRILTTEQIDIPSKPLSKLQQLALARKKANDSQQNNDNDVTTESKPVSKLSALAKSRKSNAIEKPSSGNKSLDILQNLSLHSKDATSTKTPLQKTKGLSRFSNRIKTPLKQQKELEPEQVSDSTTTKAGQKPKLTIPGIDFSIELDTKDLLKEPYNSISSFLFDLKRVRDEDTTEHHKFDNRNKRRRFSTDLFHPLTNKEISIETSKKIQKNFNEPSPDDKILAAQQAAFEDSVKDLKLSDSKNSETDSPKDKPKATKAFKKVDLAQELSTNKIYQKPHKSFVVIGHVDAGKSTLMGRLLYDVGVVDAKTVNKLVREAEKSGKGSFALAWIMDQTSEERSRGVTVDICATEFETKKTRFTAIDAPGHKDFVPQMVGGVTQAEVALLVVDSIGGEFEAGFTMDGQTKEHTLLAKNLGIQKLCVAVNKMDKENWSEARFHEIKNQLETFLVSDEVGFEADNIQFIPISGLSGNNVVKTEKIPEFEWYEGPTLLNYLENVNTSGSVITQDSATQIEQEDFALSINDVFTTSSSEFGITGKILSGFIQPGETIKVSPSDDYLQILSIKANEKNVDISFKGETVTLAFKLAQLANKSIDELSIGDLILRIESPVKTVKKFTANIRLFNMDKPLLIGTPFVLFRNNSYVPARISKILKIEDSKKKKKMHLVSKQSALVEIEVTGDRLLPVTKYEDNRLLGRIVIRREGTTVGAGVVTNV